MLQAAMEVDADVEPCYLEPESPPPIPPPGPRARPEWICVSEVFLGELRAAYGPKAVTDDGRSLGELPEVRRWLEGLRVGRLHAVHEGPGLGGDSR